MSTALLPPGNISSGTWTWRDPLVGCCVGFSNAIWFNFRGYNAMPSKKKSDLSLWMRVVFLWQSLPITNVNFSEMKNLPHLTGLSPLKVKAIEFGGYALAGLNARTFWFDLYKLDLSQAVGIQKLYVIAFKATPYLMVITNIALMALQLRYNQMGAAVGLATTLGVIPLINLLPAHFSQKVYSGISLPLQAINFYYGGNWTRFYMISSWALFSTSYGRKIQFNLLSRLVEPHMRDEYEKLDHEGDCVCVYCSGYHSFQDLLKSLDPSPSTNPSREVSQ